MIERGLDRVREGDGALPAGVSLEARATRPGSVWSGLARRLEREAPSLDDAGPAASADSSQPGSNGEAAVRRARARRLSLAQVLLLSSFAAVAFFILCALVPEWVAPYAPTLMHGDAVLTGPSAEHWLGADQFGRDVFSLVVYGARQSLLVGVSAVLVGCGVGVSIGLVAGYFGGWVDLLAMRLIDIWMAVPNILLAIALSTALGPSLGTTILAVSVASVPRYARVLRGRALAVRGQMFVLAARASGASHLAILRGHILPHCIAPALVLATLGVGNAILMASGLSFLGLGVNDDRPDWGYQLTQARAYLTVAWWAVTFPGLALTALVISVNLLGDALRRRLDPHGRAHGGNPPATTPRERAA